MSIWPPGGPTHTTHIFPTCSISLYHSMASGRPYTHHTHFSHGFNITVSLFGLREALDTPHTFFPQVQYHCVTFWPPGGPTHTTHIFPTGPISLCHSLASGRPYIHHTHFSHGFNITVSLFGLREALDTPHTFFPQVQYHCVTLWPPGGPTHTTHIFPTGSISLCHLLASYNNN